MDEFDRNDDVVVTSASKLALPEEVTGRAGLDLHYSEAHGVAFAAFALSDVCSKPRPKPARGVFGADETVAISVPDAF